MSLATVYRSALGSTASLGDMYDARTDSFCGISALKRQLPNTTQVFVDNSFSDVQYVYTDKISDKFSKLNVHAELQVSVLLGLFTLSGSGGYIGDHKTSARSVRSSLVYYVKTKDERLNIYHEDIKSVFSLDAIKSNLGCTHIVTEIEWGANSMLTCQYDNTENQNKKEIMGKLGARMKMVGLSISGMAEVNITDGEAESSTEFKFRVFGDIIPDDDMPTSMTAAVELMKKVPKLIKNTNNGMGKPIAFKLVPISMLKDYLSMEIGADTIVKSLEQSTLTRVVQFFEELENVQQTVTDFYTDTMEFEYCVSPQDVLAVMKLKNDLAIYESKIRSDLATILIRVRSGDLGPEKMDDFLTAFYSNSLSPQNVTARLKSWSTVQDQINFARTVKLRGAKYIGKVGTIMDEILDNDEIRMIVLFFKPNARYWDAERWNENNQIFFHELKQRNSLNGDSEFFVVDGSFHHIPSNFSSTIRVLQKGTVVIEDLLADHKAFQGKSLVTWEEDPTRIVRTPKDLIDFRATCPGKTCNGTNIYSWTCKQCGQKIRLGNDDQLYCGCGRSSLLFAKYRCSDPKHGLNYDAHNQEYLQELLLDLKPSTTPPPVPRPSTCPPPPKCPTCPTTPPRTSKVSWVTPRNKVLPAGALLAGYESSGQRVYIMKVNYETGTILGKVNLDCTTCTTISGAYFGWANKEHVASNSPYQVLVAPVSEVRWDIAIGSSVPRGAIMAGLEPGTSNPYYVCRLSVQGKLIPGRLYTPKRNCYTSLGGREYYSNVYEVLVDLSKV